MSARSSASRGDLEGRAVAGGGLGPAEHRSGAVRLAARSRPRAPASTRATSGRRRPPGPARPGRRRPPRRWRPSGPARAPPRPGPGEGSWAPPRRRPGGPRSRTPASAGRARGAGGCRPGRRARGPASSSRRARALAAPSHSANVMDPTSTTAKAVLVAELRGHAAPGARPSARMRVPPRGWSAPRKLTPVSGSLQHGRCASGGQSRG